MRTNSIYIHIYIYVLKNIHTLPARVFVCVCKKNMYRYVCIYIHTWMQMMWFFQHRVTEIVSQTQTVQVNLNSPEDQFGEDAKRQFFGSNDFITLLHVYITLFSLSLYILCILIKNSYTSISFFPCQARKNLAIRQPATSGGSWRSGMLTGALWLQGSWL